MGLDINALYLLIQARKTSLSFHKVLTLGVQEVNVYEKPLRRVLQRAGFDLLDEDVSPSPSGMVSARRVLRSLGADEVITLDASSYEGAQIIHNLNTPISRELEGQFDLVFDGGTLEHVFNIPVAIANCMKAIRIGGGFISITPANNCFGHGFYQLGADFYWRALSIENGFRTDCVAVHGIGPYNRWYRVPDPRKLQQRTELISFRPMAVFALAVRVAERDIFSAWPQQTSYNENDYDRMRRTLNRSSARRGALRIHRSLPSVARFLHVARMAFLFYSRQSLWNRRVFIPLRKELCLDGKLLAS